MWCALWSELSSVTLAQVFKLKIELLVAVEGTLHRPGLGYHASGSHGTSGKDPDGLTSFCGYSEQSECRWMSASRNTREKDVFETSPHQSC